MICPSYLGQPQTFYDAVADFNGQVIPTLILLYLFYVALQVTCVVLGSWLRKVLLFRWRVHLTDDFQNKWLTQHKQYRLQLEHEPDNPDQRIAEDCAMLAEQSIDLFKNFVMNAARLVAFVAALWAMSGIQKIDLFGREWTVHGYLVWIALAYTLFCSLATHWIGRKLQMLNVERQHREADYRATLLKVRDYAEQIAFYHGEKAEQARLNGRFAAIRRNWFALIARELRLEIFSSAYMRISIFIPIIATLPLYLARTMTFGDMMQARSAFTQVQDGFSWFVDYYKRIIEWAAVVQRLAQFQTALQTIASPESEADLPAAAKAETVGGSNDCTNQLDIHDLTVHTAEGHVLLEHVDFQVNNGEWLLLDGRSGIGKSTLLRTLAGLWPYYRGSFSLAGSDKLFLPQRPYLPQDSLRAVIGYPFMPDRDDETIKRILQQVGLARLGGQLDEEREWHKVLSGGEQQRLSLARVLLHRPNILFLDEATNQLDDDAALSLMQMIRENLPNTLCLAVSHQPGVKALFKRKVDLGEFSRCV
ncbi:MAG: ABC transporter ATP-binding protein/permease [Neisseria sp.]|uniref:ABC transporter ATP-binding protein/permease n=1 Tax=Neisseria sp. TaxID=192066 RepID=UPI0026DC2A74|nr:ABC transporter ATP-binding protein/permease [Neisseria sp.]MDO4640704.1 ABC transporter ATP-binding protein/permease [Neisseria sp.]